MADAPEWTRTPATNPHAASRPFLPVALLCISLIFWTGFQLTQLLSEHSSLVAARAGQQREMEQSLRLRSALDALATDTAKLADTGNPNAKTIVTELKKRGITINPNAGKGTKGEKP